MPKSSPLSTTKIILYTDGGARGNPGPAGAGAVILDAEERVLKEARQFLGETTNNEAEYRAVIFGLETAKRHFGKKNLPDLQFELRLDSELVASQLRGEYQIKEKSLWPFFIKIWNLRATDFRHLTFVHVPRVENARAVRLANEAMDEGGASSSLPWPES